MTLQPDYKVKNFVDLKSIGAWMLAMMLTTVPETASWMTYINAGLVMAATLTTIGYNIIKMMNEIYDRKNRIKKP